MHRYLPVLGLFLLAPLVGEFLLGNVAITGIALLPLFALLYGSGALLIRELARRAGRGWPTIGLLAAAYALVEEGPVDQLLWNDSYAGHDYLHGPSYLLALGMSVELTQTVLALHVVWSICVPIALVEACVPDRAETPWLGRIGLLVTGIVFALGAGIVFAGTYSEEGFVASPAQLGGIGVVIIGLVALAFRLPALRVRPVDVPVPAPLWVGAAALAATSVYWAPSVLVTAEWYEWAGVCVWVVVAVVGVTTVLAWSRRRDWGPRHRFALAAGATLTYVWVAFPVQPEEGGVSIAVDILGNAVLGAAAIALLIVAGRRVGAGSRAGADQGLRATAQ